MESARVVLVTNVGQGYGRAVALAYGRAGYDVVCADRDVDLAAKTASEVEELGGQAIPIQADMTTQMDVLSAYHKVMEIFGALGGVVHLAGQVSTTPFEDLAEGEFYEVMAENVRSTFLALKAASRLLSNGWVVIVAPPAMSSVQMHATQGALREMVNGFCKRFAYPRVNIVLPSRPPSDPRHDQALVRAVRYLGSPESAGVNGQVMDVELPSPPRIAESLLPEVRAALDPNVRQSDETDYGQLGWSEAAGFGGGPSSDAAERSTKRAARRYPAGVASHLWTTADFGADARDSAEDRDDEPAGLGRAYLFGGPSNGASELVDDDDLYEELAFDDDGAGDDELNDYAGDDDDYDESEVWAYDLGLPEGPALRHLVAHDDPLDHDAYASGHDTARDLYGDLGSLGGLDDDDDPLGPGSEPGRS